MGSVKIQVTIKSTSICRVAEITRALALRHRVLLTNESYMSVGFVEVRIAKTRSCTPINLGLKCREVARKIAADSAI